jgi:hypothetical protein
MVTLGPLVQNILASGYQRHRETVDVKFNTSRAKDTTVASFEVEFVDGFSKALSCLFILNAIIELVWVPRDLGPVCTQP